jgi:hypothetical protein
MNKKYRLKIEVRDQLQDTFEALRMQRVLPEALAPLSRVKWRQSYKTVILMCVGQCQVVPVHTMNTKMNTSCRDTAPLILNLD